jgi:redox-sensitive bicupin YhaK (pirin superfamily)
MAIRSIYAHTRLAEHRMNEAFGSHSLRAGSAITLDPYISIDVFRMSQPTFPPHPHAGLSAITYLLPNSPGGFLNRDSFGDHSRITPGSLHWTQAAGGMMHEEIPEHPGTLCLGLQIFVNLKATDKLATPARLHLDTADVPVAKLPGASVRVLAGEFGGLASPINPGLLTKVQMLHVLLDASASITVPAPANQTAFAIALDGAGTAGAIATKGPEPDEQLSLHTAVGFADDGNELHFEAGPNGLSVFVGAGHPIHEPLVFGGPFAMNTDEQIAESYARFKRGEMGRLAPSI